MLTFAFPTAAQVPDEPFAVRNQTPLAGEEVLVLRHQKLKPGGHDAYYRLSAQGVWPWFEKLGSRTVGQWKVIHPDGSPAPADHENGYRLVRYASLEHWKATRQGWRYAGNGPDYHASAEALRERQHFALGSDGAHFFQGVMSTAAPQYLPAVEETYEPVEAPEAGGPRPYRNDIAWVAREIVVWDRWKILKGAHEEFIQATVRDVWPYLEKVGARAVGVWREIYPEGSAYDENPDYDEVHMIVRYAGYEHWKAARPGEIITLGGDGPDWQAYESTLKLQDRLASESSRRFMQGFFHTNPPYFRPGLNEHYRKAQ